MYLVLLLAAAALLRDCHSAPSNKHLKAIPEIDNSIEHSGLPKKTSPNRFFLTIAKRPQASYAYKAGEILHLSCEAIGAPAPSVRWFKNDVPVYEFDMESNEVLDSNPSSVARMLSTLIISRPSKSGQDVYTCLATSGSKTARASTIVYNTAGGSTDVSERSRLYPLTPQIVVRYKVVVDTIGSSVVLPCRARGHPRPKHSWVDNQGNDVTDNARMKVLRSGALAISSLSFDDLGDFTCRATNVFGTTTSKTFIYPAKAS